MASPVVAGVAALLFAACPSLTPTQCKQALYDTATDLGNPGWDELYGYGEVNAEAAVQAVLKSGWTSVGDSTYFYKNGIAQTGWAVTSIAPDGESYGLQRYWLGADGKLATDRLIDPSTAEDASAGYWAFATASGYVARGKCEASDGRVYLADNDGRLENPGWLVSAFYGDGLQRYWVDPVSHACVPGYSTDGWPHYTVSAGYVLRGAAFVSDGSMRYADNDGLLMKSDWLVTSAFGQGLQRYWFGADGKLATDRLIDPSTVEDASAGYWAFATASGYVVRGKYETDGKVYLADNDGRLEGSGWLVSASYGDGLQRYWVDSTSHACVPGYSADGWPHYTMPAGYVLRGTYTVGSVTYMANNDGLIQ